MKKIGLIVLTWIVLQTLSFAQVSVGENPAWKPASAEDIASLASQPGVQVINFSMYSDHSGAFLIKTPAGIKVNHGFVEGTVTGYTKGIEKKGFHLVERRDMRVGPLPTVLLRSEQDTGNGKSVVLSYMLYADHDLYSLTFFGEPDLSPVSPMVLDYLNRLQYSPDLVPANIGGNSDFELGRKIGSIVGVLFAVFAILGIALFCAFKFRSPA